MKSWDSILIAPDTSLHEAIAKIDVASTQLALVVDAERRLLGTVSDGDVRRGLLAGMKLTDPVERCMFCSPTTARVGESREAIVARMRSLMVHQMPVLDDGGRVVDLKTIDDYLAVPERENWVIIMAGGLGSRLRELTSETPKPMLMVGGRPLLETIVRRFVEQGFRHIWLAVNYCAEQIEAYFGDGSAFGAVLRYIREDKRLGTAGALSLLPEAPTAPVLVTNADLLVAVDFGEMLDAHVSSGASATMAVREYEYQIPYGVVRTAEDQISSLEEKPMHRVMVNAGIYTLDPGAITHVPHNTFFDMPELFAAMLELGVVVRSHRINGYWLDIGRKEDYHKANGDIWEVFER
jgi:dTDP-glucose pyrophosphorylase